MLGPPSSFCLRNNHHKNIQYKKQALLTTPHTCTSTMLLSMLLSLTAACFVLCCVVKTGEKQGGVYLS